MRVLTPRGYEAYRANRYTQMHACRPHESHADPACFASLLGSREQRVSTEWGSRRFRDLHRGRMPGESAAGDETSSRAAVNSRAWQVHAQAGPYGASTGLGCLRLGWGVFSVSKLGWCESMTGRWKLQKWSRGNKGIPPHTSLKSGNSRNQDYNTVNKNLRLNHSQCNKITTTISAARLEKWSGISLFLFCVWARTVRNMLQLLLWEVCITGVSV